MLRPDRDPQTGLPLVQETRLNGGRWKSLPKWAQAAAIEADQSAEAPWVPGYLEWQGPTLHRLRCWKCGVDLFGWRMVIDQHGNRVERDGKSCLWLRAYDHYTATPVTIRWGCLKKTAIFDALHCKDCQMLPADLPMLLAVFLSGHTAMLEHGWTNDLPLAMGRHSWATYLYRYSDAQHIQCEPVGLRIKNPKEVPVNIPTAGKPMYPSDYLAIGEAVQAAKFWPGMIVEFDRETKEIPPGWTAGPRAGTIRKL